MTWLYNKDIKVSKILKCLLNQQVRKQATSIGSTAVITKKK